VVEGTIENNVLVTRLLTEVQVQGLDVADGVLFVVDGS
jgi:hypothetical protein